MSKPISGNAKRVFSLRLPKEIVFASKDIPSFRSKLEAYAKLVHSDWVKAVELEMKKGL